MCWYQKHFRSDGDIDRSPASRVTSAQSPIAGLFNPQDRVDSLVADMFFVVEGADVGRDERFDAVPESSRGFAERLPARSDRNALPPGVSRLTGGLSAHSDQVGN